MGVLLNLRTWNVVLSVTVVGMQSPAQQWQFTDISENCGFGTHSDNHGIAIVDFDGDGFEDIYVSVRSGKNKLYRNKGHGEFADVAQAAGVDLHHGTRTAVWGDIDCDGDPDLYLGNATANDKLYLNRGDGAFQDITAYAGILNMASTFSVNMADLNSDGYPDIYVSNFLNENILFVNNRDTTFSDAMGSYHLSDPGRSMGAVFFDYDNDGDSDLYLVHDGNEPNILYRNTDGQFEDVSAPSKTDFAGQGMGVDIADINNDGYLDIYITNLYENALLLNNGDGTFEDISAQADIRDYGMGWGVTFLDFDNDGWVDIYVCNDSYFSPYPNVLYRNTGNLTFSKYETGGPVSNVMASYGCACTDMDMDGALDLVVANRGNHDFLQLFKNNGSGNHWIGFQLIGTNGNTAAIGGRVIITDNNGVIHTDEITAGNGYASQNSMRLHFGLGQASQIDSLMIRWPSGNRQAISPPEVDRYYTIVEDQSPKVLNPSVTTAVRTPADLSPDLQCYPNPSSGDLHITFSLTGPDKGHVSIYDMTGVLHYRSGFQHRQAGQTDHVISGDLMDQMGPGSLLVQLSGKKGNASQIIVRQ